MISNTKHIWRLESKWSDHDRFWTDHDRKLAERKFTCAHKHSRQRSYKNYGKTRKTKGIYGKTRKPLRRRECNYPILMKTEFRKTANIVYSSQQYFPAFLTAA